MNRISVFSIIDFFWFATVAGFGITILITIVMAAMFGGPNWVIFISYNSVHEGILDLLLVGFLVLWLPRIYLLLFKLAIRPRKFLKQQ